MESTKLEISETAVVQSNAFFRIIKFKIKYILFQKIIVCQLHWCISVKHFHEYNNSTSNIS